MTVLPRKSAVITHVGQHGEKENRHSLHLQLDHIFIALSTFLERKLVKYIKLKHMCSLLIKPL